MKINIVAIVTTTILFGMWCFGVLGITEATSGSEGGVIEEIAIIQFFIKKSFQLKKEIKSQNFSSLVFKNFPLLENFIFCN